MAYKVLGQAAPAATTDTTLYTAPSQAVISSLTIANRGTNVATFRIAVRPDGAALANQHYLAYDLPVSGNDLVVLTIGLTLDLNDVITVRGSTADLSFGAYGQEV